MHVAEGGHAHLVAQARLGYNRTMNDPSHNFVWLDGRCLPKAEAYLPIGDRAFRYGDGLFETLRVSGGLPEFWNAHIARLEEGLRALRFPPLTFDIKTAARELLRANRCTESVLRLTISRGEGGRGYLPAPQPTPLMLLETSPLPPMPGGALTLWHATIRRPDPCHLPTHCKLSNALGSVLARMEAEDHGCGEALLTNARGTISEASAANLVWQEQDGRLFTPSLESGAVAGVARRMLMQVFAIEECLAPSERLQNATALVACNSLRHAQPVAKLLPQEWRWDSSAVAARCNEALITAAEASRNEFA